jgi:hypothetical protein
MKISPPSSGRPTAIFIPLWLFEIEKKLWGAFSGRKET